jgi:hypothetical protein
VVVDDVEDHGQPLLVGRLDQGTKLYRVAIGTLRGEVVGRPVAHGDVAGILDVGEQGNRVESHPPDVVEFVLELRERGHTIRPHVDTVAIPAE